MKLLRTLLCLLTLLAASRTASAAAWVVGTHRATGSYTCRLGPFNSATFSVDTYLYLSQRAAHSWYVYLSGDFNSSTDVTLDVRDSYLIESADNGSVVYTIPQDTIYVHRLIPFQPVDYTHDMRVPQYDIQVLPVSAAHPYGQLVIYMLPQGASDPTKGECAEPVTVTLEIQP